MLDENMKWQEHKHTVENKITKNIRLLYRAENLLNKLSLKCIYFAYIHSYLNYANIARVNTYQTQLKRIHLLQKCAVHIIFNENNITHPIPFCDH